MKIFRFLFTPIMMGLLLIVLAIVMAAATFIENDFGADAARQIVYNTRWFELIFLLLVTNLTGQIITFKLYRREKLTVMLFHIAFIVMIIGAAITRYTGFDGMIHIREGEA
ncbi:MAG: cytochrome C biogenesis protein, partial [Bacteroidales bacterium]